MRVLVIGGGIGGLCLAHGLRGAGIDVEVYERTRVRSDWLQGYRIHLNPNGCRALHRCLPAANWAAFDAIRTARDHANIERVTTGRCAHVQASRASRE